MLEELPGVAGGLGRFDVEMAVPLGLELRQSGGESDHGYYYEVGYDGDEVCVESGG